MLPLESSSEHLQKSKNSWVHYVRYMTLLYGAYEPTKISGGLLLVGIFPNFGNSLRDINLVRIGLVAVLEDLGCWTCWRIIPLRKWSWVVAMHFVFFLVLATLWVYHVSRGTSSCRLPIDYSSTKSGESDPKCSGENGQCHPSVSWA